MKYGTTYMKALKTKDHIKQWHAIQCDASFYEITEENCVNFKFAVASMDRVVYSILSAKCKQFFPDNTYLLEMSSQLLNVSDVGQKFIIELIKDEYPAYGTM